MKDKTSKRPGQAGFTVIELVAMLVVIGVLIGLVFATYSGVQRDQHNQQRQNDIQIIYQQLETYYVGNSKYPTLSEINNPAWVKANMKMLNQSTLRDPSSSSYVLEAHPTKDAYSYEVTAADGGACNNISRICAHYTLTATLQNASPSTYIKSSLN